MPLLKKHLKKNCLLKIKNHMNIYIYKQIIDSMSSFMTISQHIKKSGEIKLVAEDSNLAIGVNNLIIDLQFLHRRSKSKSTPLTISQTPSCHYEILKKYCIKQLKSKKPKWQIMAERKEWTPPSSQ